MDYESQRFRLTKEQEREFMHIFAERLRQCGAAVEEEAPAVCAMAYEALDMARRKGFWPPISRHFGKQAPWAGKHYQSAIRRHAFEGQLTDEDKKRISELLWDMGPEAQPTDAVKEAATVLEGRNICPKLYQDFVYQELKRIREKRRFTPKQHHAPAPPPVESARE